MKLVTAACSAMLAAVASAATVEVGELFADMGAVSWSQKQASDGMVALTLEAKASEGCAFSGWTVDGSEPEWGMDARMSKLSGVLVPSNAVVQAAFVDGRDDILQFDVADGLSDFVCGEPVSIWLDIDSASYPTLSLKGLPAGLSFDSKTLTVSGTPNTPCVRTVVVSGTNGSGYRFSQTFTASVSDISSGRVSGRAIEDIPLGVYYHAELDDLFQCDGERSSVTLSGIPPGLEWNDSWNLLYGTPTSSGTYVIWADVRFPDGRSETATTRMTVVAPDPADYSVELEYVESLSVGDRLEAEDCEIGRQEDGLGIVWLTGLPNGLSVKTWYDGSVKYYGIEGLVREAGRFTIHVTINVPDSDGVSTIDAEQVIFVSDTPDRYLRVSVSPDSPEGSGKVSGGGALSVASGATIKASPASGYVFAGWYDADGEIADVGYGKDYRNPSIVYDADVEVEFIELFALFVRSEDDAEMSIASLDGGSFSFNLDDVLDEEFEALSRSMPKFTAKGLPAGVSIIPTDSGLYRLNYDPDTATAIPSPGRYQVALTAKNSSGVTDSATFLLTVENITDARIDVESDYGELSPIEEITPIDLSAAVDFESGETLSVSGLPRGLVYNKTASASKGVAANTITGTPTVPGYYTLTFTAKVVASETVNADGRVVRTYETAKATAFLTVLPYPLLSVDVSADALEAGNSVSGVGNYKPGTKVTLKAKAAKGWVFAGWDGLWDVDGMELLKPTVTLTTDSEDLGLGAVFIPLSEDVLSIAQPSPSDSGFDAEFELGSDVAQGDYSELILNLLETVSYPTVKVSGLPSGVKFSSSSLTLSGKPSKSGVYYATVSAKNAGGYSFTRILRIAVLEKDGEPPDEPEPDNAAQIDFSPLEGLVTGTYYASGDIVVGVGESPASGAAPVKATVSGTPAGLVASAEQVGDGLEISFVGTPSKVARYSVVVKVAYADKSSLVSRANLIVEDGGSAYIEVVSSDESLGTVTGGGVYSAGATVKLSAKPRSKCAFAGWFFGEGEDAIEPFAPLVEIDGMDCREASVSFPFRPDDLAGVEKLVGAFASSEDDSSISFDFEGAVWEIDPESASEFQFSVDSLSIPKITTKNLPKGVTVDLARGKLVYTPADSVKSGIYDATFSARNSSAATVSAELEIRVANRESEVIDGLDPSMDAYAIHAGVAFDPSLIAPEVAADEGWSLAAAGLPTGLKFVKDKDTGAYFVTGVSTAKPGSYTVTFTASRKGEKNQVATITLNVEALPEWAVGTFAGAVALGGAPSLPAGPDALEGAPVVGTVTLTVDAKGKISGKLLEGGRTWSLAAGSFDGVEMRPVDAENAEAGERLVYLAKVVAKNGKDVVTNEIAIAAEAVRTGDDESSLRGVVSGQFDPESTLEWAAWQNLWKDEPWKSEASQYANSEPLVLYVAGNEVEGYDLLTSAPDDGSDYGTLTLKFASAGAVTAAGRFVKGFDGKTNKTTYHSVTCSSVLTPIASMDNGNKYGIYLYFLPNKSGFNGFAAGLAVEWNGKKFLLSE